MKRLSLLLGAMALVFSVGCQEAAEIGPGELGKLEPAKKTQELGRLPFVLPAHKLPGDEHIPGKADQYSDVRDAHPQWYAITEKPEGDYRPMIEWEPMQSVVLTFSNYMPGDAPVFQTFSDIIVNSVPVADVWIIVDSDSAKNQLEDKLLDDGLTQGQIDDSIEFFRWQNDAIWMIDYGPLPIVDSNDTVAFMDFRYYHQRVYDDAMPTILGNEIGVTTYRSPLNLEGGNFQADGEEYCYTTERELYYTGLSATELEDFFIEWYGCKKLAILKDITDDGTGHIDMLFKLADKHKAVLGEYTVVNDPTNKQRMDDNADLLESLVFEDGGTMVVHRLPFPTKFQNTPPPNHNTMINNGDGQKVNLWPMYTIDKDIEEDALAAWQTAMPEWEHIGIISDQISLYSGAVHCITRTIPALPFQKWVADGECVDGMCQGDGYTGACISGDELTPGCWGPAWQCPCNDCSVCVDIESCGNGVCEAGNGETCANCVEDCGCADGETCTDGECGAYVGCAGYCGGESPDGCYCDDACDGYGDCCPNACDECDLEFCGEPDPCAGKDCGSDGAGGSCGECDHGFECVAGICEEKAGAECGDGACDMDETCDSCPADCGCEEGSECVNGACLAPCEDECLEGETGCEGNAPWTCALPPDAMCMIKSIGAVCDEGLTCDATTGACTEGGGPGEDTIDGEDTTGGEDVTGGGSDGDSDGGNNCNAGGSNPMAGALVLFAMLGLAVIRRRVIV